jgi:hypothetical protein
MGDGIQEEVLRALVEQHAVRECLVAKIDGGPNWGLSIRLGQPDGGGTLFRQRRP